MCGIAGFIGTLPETEAVPRLKAMAAAMQRRGPDDEGVYFDANAGVGLCHRRLAIIDLTPSGHQPMASPDGRYVIVFNGEIYNFERLRAELAARGARFRGTSDTEVLLHGVAAWGVRETLRRSIGMFAIALWDRAERVLYLARDRLGEKPLYLARSPHGLAFASDLSALRAAHLIDPGLDTTALALYLKYGYVPAPHAIHVDSSKLMPGSIVAIAPAAAPHPPELGAWQETERTGGYALFSTRYWEPPATAQTSSAAAPTSAERQEEFDALLTDAVALQLHADVPVGAFLSGGIDSSLVCSVAQSVATQPVNTFTMGFDDSLFDESDYAAAVARHLGTNHTCVRVSADDTLRVVPRIAEIYDEPFADPSQLPTFLVSQIARRSVTVCLTGDGGDELFGGYNRYIEPVRIRRVARHVPRALRSATARALQAVPARWADAGVAGVIALFGRGRISVQSPGRKVHKLAEVLTTTDPRVVYEDLMTHWRSPPELLGAQAPNPSLFGPVPWSWDTFVDNAMLWDLEHYLPDNNLAKVDRASMAVSLETRLPLLDHRIVELARRTPLEYKIAGGVGKVMLRNSLRRFLPAELIDRPKMGFSVPLAAWLRGPLREWAGDFLAADTTRRLGLFDPGVVGTCWREHLSGKSDHYLRLWLVVVAHSWLSSIRGETAHLARSAAS